MSITSQVKYANRLGFSGLARSLSRNMYRARNRYAPSANPRMRMSRAVAQRSARGSLLSRTRNKRKTLSGLGVTTQQDKKFIYAKKYMPRAKKRRWKKFVQKVHAVAEKDLGSRTVVMNKQYDFSNSTPTAQLVGCMYLYGQKGFTAGEPGGDLNIIGGLENTGAATATGGMTVWGSTKLRFQSAVLDVTIRNASTRVDSGPTTVSAGEAKLELDIYECIVRRATEETGAAYNSFLSLLNDNNTEISPIGGTGTELTYLMRGSTPFDQTYSISRWGIKILKKTKYFIPNGDTITYQIRDPRRWTVTRDDCINQDGFNRPGRTRVLFMVAKLVTGLDIGTGVGTYQERINVGATRKYMYKVEGANDDRASYITT